MEDFNISNASQDKNCNYSNITNDRCDNSNILIDFEYYKNVQFIMHVVTCVIICIGLPLTLGAIYAVYCQVRNDHVAPIYVINLLISDVIQLCCFIVREVQQKDLEIRTNGKLIHYFGVAASVCFMMFIALERYLVICCPVWYHNRRTIKISVVVCVVGWAIPLVFLLTFYFWDNFQAQRIIFTVCLLLPFPLFIFCLGGTLKALSASRVPSDEKRRIVGILVLVLLIYTLLFLPSIIFFLLGSDKYIYNFTFNSLSFMFIMLSPLADLVLYIFMRKGTVDKLLASVCCCKMDSNDTNVPTV